MAEIEKVKEKLLKDPTVLFTINTIDVNTLSPMILAVYVNPKKVRNLMDLLGEGCVKTLLAEFLDGERVERIIEMAKQEAG